MMTRDQLLKQLVEQLDEAIDQEYADGNLNRDGWKTLGSFIVDFRGAVRGTHANITEPPDYHCYTLPNGKCVSQCCRLHAVS